MSLVNLKTVGNLIWSNWTIGWGLALMVLGICLVFASLGDLYRPSGATLAAGGGALATAGGVLIALGTFIRRGEDDRSKFYLENALQGIERAYGLLEDGNNDRGTWILAARILARTIRLTANITVAAHLETFEIIKDDYRAQFHDILKAGSWDIAAFFMGSSEHLEALEAALERQNESEEPLNIPEEALVTIYEFARYPDDYDDPLGRKFTHQELLRLRLIFRSLYRYVLFSNRRQMNPAVRVRQLTNEEVQQELEDLCSTRER